MYNVILRPEKCEAYPSGRFYRAYLIDPEGVYGECPLYLKDEGIANLKSRVSKNLGTSDINFEVGRLTKESLS